MKKDLTAREKKIMEVEKQRDIRRKLAIAEAIQKQQLKVGDRIRYVPGGKKEEYLTESSESRYKYMLAYEKKIGKLLYITPSNRYYIVIEDGMNCYFTVEPWDVEKAM